MYEECLYAVLQENKSIALYDGIMNRYDLLSPGEQEDDEGEDGRGEDDLHLGVQTRLGSGAGHAAIW